MKIVKKIASEEIDNLFKKLNSDKEIKNLVYVGYFGKVFLNGIIPYFRIQFRHPEEIRAMLKTSYNAFCKVYVGSMYDEWGTSKSAPSEEKLQQTLKANVDKLLARISQLLHDSKEFNNIKVELANKELQLSVISDGRYESNDKYVGSVFLKFSYI